MKSDRMILLENQSKEIAELLECGESVFVNRTISFKFIRLIKVKYDVSICNS